MKDIAPSLTEVAVIIGAHGIRGQVKLLSFTNPPELLFGLSPITDAKGNEYALQQQGAKGNQFTVAIKGVTDRNSAELLKRTSLFAKSDNVPQTEQSLLHGLKVRLPDGNDYGVVEGVYNFGAGDIIEIARLDGSLEMLPLSLPFVDIASQKKGFITAHPPEYVEAKE